jgi:hypothetical protein
MMILILVLIALNQTIYAQHNQALSNADTTFFSVNTDNGWKLFNSFIKQAQSTDSVQLEIICFQTVPLDWTNVQYIGKIKNSSFFPSQDQVVKINLISCFYEVLIKTNGKCYLKFYSGQLPGGSNNTIPINIYYRL